MLGISTCIPIEDEPMSKIKVAENFTVDQSDINHLSWRWHQVIGSIEYLSAKNSLTILDSIINSYMRGQGYKMGNWKGVEKHYGKASGLLFLVVEDSLDKYEELRWIRAAIPAQD